MTTFGSYPDIEVTVDGHIAVVEMQRPPHNYFDTVIVKSIAESGLKWPAEMRRYGADLLSDPDDLLDVLPTDVGGSLDSLSF